MRTLPTLPSLSKRRHGVVLLSGIKNGGLARRLENLFPEREFFMRSQGSVRFIKVSSRLQKTVAGGVVLALLVWAISMGVMSWMQYLSLIHI